MLFLFIKSFMIGFAIAAPVGPIGLLCIQRSLRDGLKIGLMTGLGAATADTLYGLIAALGLTALSSFLMTYQNWIHLIGGIFLMLLGLHLFLKHQHAGPDKNSSDPSPWHAYITTLLLTLMNPLTIFSFMAIFAGIGLGSKHPDYLHAFVLVLGIFLGSSLWWLFLSTAVTSILQQRIQEKSMGFINKIAGGMLFIFGLIALFFRG